MTSGKLIWKCLLRELSEWPEQTCDFISYRSACWENQVMFCFKDFHQGSESCDVWEYYCYFFFLSPRCLHYCKTKLMKLQSIQLSSYTKNPKEGNFVFSDSRARIKFSFSKAQWEKQLRGGKKAHLSEPVTEAVVKSSGASCLCDLSSLERARGVRAWLKLAFSQCSVNSTRSLNDVSTGSKGNRWLRAQEAERLPEQPLARHW